MINTCTNPSGRYLNEQAPNIFGLESAQGPQQKRSFRVTLQPQASQKGPGQQEQYFFLKMPRGSSTEHQVDKIEVIAESDCSLSNSARSDESCSCLSSSEESNSESCRGNDAEGSELKQSFEEQSENIDRKDSRIILMIKKLTQGDINTNESFNQNQYSLEYPRQSEEKVSPSQLQSNNTSLQKIFVPENLANSFHLGSQVSSVRTPGFAPSNFVSHTMSQHSSQSIK